MKMLERSVRIAVMGDLHYAAKPNDRLPCRKGEHAPALLASALHRLNGEIRPDAVIMAGDLINDPTADDAEKLTAEIAEILRTAEAPRIVIRGNHDIPAGRFEKIFPFPAETEINGVKIIAFDDPETPGCNAVRTESDIRRMRQARETWQGPILSLQHVPLMPSGRCIYAYSNAEELIDVMTECRYSGTVSAHYHQGIPIRDGEEGPLRFHVQSALCEAPFSCGILEVGQDGVLRTVSQIPIPLPA